MVLQHTDQQPFKYFNSITHEGKIILIATDDEGILWYTVKQDGFEDTYLQEDPNHRTGWEKWNRVPLPGRRKNKNGEWIDEQPDPSVIEREQEQYSVPQGSDQLLIRSQYQSWDQSIAAPVQLISGLGHLYIFRQSKQGTLLVDRFVLDGMTNKLVRKLEVRFKRSGQKYQPLQSTKPGQTDQLSTIDSLDFRDANDRPFYEPTIELGLVRNLQDGHFAVVLVPTNNHDVHRWHFFVYESSKELVEAISIRSSEEGLFDIRDQFTDESSEPVSGIIRRSLTWLNLYQKRNSLKHLSGLTAVKYDLQKEAATKAGKQLLRESTRVMLMVRVLREMAAISFAVATDGTLSQIQESTTTERKLLRAVKKEVLLPLNTLDEIKAIGDSTPPPGGRISGLFRHDENDLLLVESKEVLPDNLGIGDRIRIEDTMANSGYFEKISEATDEGFTVSSKPETPSQIGHWTKLEKEADGAVFEGIILGQRLKQNGLEISSPGHGLNNGDDVQIEGTIDYNGDYQLIEITDETHFVLQRKWKPGHLINLKEKAAQRRGIQFNEVKAYMETPALALDNPLAGNPTGITCSAWIYTDEQDGAANRQIMIHQGGLIRMYLFDEVVEVEVKLLGISKTLMDREVDTVGRWNHFAVSLALHPQEDNAIKVQIQLCRNGTLIKTEEFAVRAPDDHSTSPVPKVDNQFYIGGHPTLYPDYNDGTIQIADVQIWNKIRSPQEIRDTMYLHLAGRESGLVGYWRMGGILPENPPKVIDFSSNRNHGTIYGDAMVTGKTLQRNLKIKIDGKPIPASQYLNEELFAVSQGAQYMETFEFRLNNGAAPPDDLFTFFYKGKKSRNTEAWIEGKNWKIKQDSFRLSPNQTAADQGWYVAKCTFTPPSGVAMVRSFGIAKVTGDWEVLQIRKHSIISVSDAITEEVQDHTLSLETIHQLLNTIHKVKALNEVEIQLGAKLRQKRRLAMLLKNANNLQFQINRKEQQLREARMQEQVFMGIWMNIGKEAQYAQQRVTLYIHQHYGGASWPLPLGTHNFSGGWYKEVTAVKVPAGLQVKLFSEVAGQELILKQNSANLGNWNDWTIRAEVSTINGFKDINHINKTLLFYTELFSNSSRQRQAYEEQLAALQEMRKKKPEELKRDLKKINQQLIQLEAEQGKLSREVFKVLQKREDYANQMSMPTLAKDDRGLETTGAILNFGMISSRISAREVSEGAIQLSYLDQDHILRTHHYDTVADSKNADFERWRLEGIRSCVDFNDTQGSFVLPEDQPVRFKGDWTIEAWVSFPLTNMTEELEPSLSKYWRTLAGSSDGRDGYIVAEYNPKENVEWLGVMVQGQFKSSNFDLATLEDGWHHLSACSRDGAVVFYLDGKEISAYPTLEKLRQAKQLESNASPDARKLVEARRSLAQEAARGSSTTTTRKLKEAIEALEKNAQVKAEAAKIQKARAEAGAQQPSSPITHIGKSKDGGAFGKVAEVRFWDTALTAEEIMVNSKTLLTGNEPQLLAYFPLDEAKGSEVSDTSGNREKVDLPGIKWWPCAAPIGRLKDAYIAPDQDGSITNVEYATIIQNKRTNQKISMLRRCWFYPSQQGIAALDEQRIEELDLLWIGNAQFDPTLLGYIEGAPPVPSENLTVESNYNGATSVKLTASEDVTFSWERTEASSLGAREEFFAGAAGETAAGIGFLTQAAEWKAGFAGSINYDIGKSRTSAIEASAALEMSDSLQLHGTQETEAKFPSLGKRFIPKNVGYALVISEMADVFISRLKRSKRMISYQVIPVKDIPPDINTITFLINPAYTMVGSLDGMTGSQATSQRFFKHVPEMRSQFGSQYPASYFRLEEAYDLKNQIDRQDKARESYFANFDAANLQDALEDQVNRGPAPIAISVNRPENKAAEKDLTEEEKKKAEEERMNQRTDEVAAGATETTAAAKEKRAEIEAKIADFDKRAQAKAGLEVWQKTMEAIQIRAGKRNIVNNYVWDADGGMRVEAQSFANVASHSCGGSYNLDGDAGFHGEFEANIAGELTAKMAFSVTRNMAKTQSYSKGFSLDVDVSGVESMGITNHDDLPLLPGEKVDRYRFMSFYLEGSTKNFNDFFNYVVDPEWLASNDEEARALR